MTAAACPACSGLRLVGDITGFRWDHQLGCASRQVDDGTVQNDFEQTRWHGSIRQRPVTAPERALLAACGVTLPASALTTVTVTASIRARSWAGVDLDG